jgi:hypothetical protein
MYPGQTELPQEENWGANLLGAGANMAVQTWQNENQWKNLAKYMNPTKGTSEVGVYNPAYDEEAYKNIGSKIMKLG